MLKKKTRILNIGIVDNDVLVAQALANLFVKVHAPIKVLWSKASGIEALAIDSAELRQTEAVLTDIEMPRMSGIEFAARLRAHNPEIAVIGITAFNFQTSQDTLAAAGITEILKKEAPTEELVQALGRAVHDVALSRWVPLLDRSQEEVQELSPRELLIIKLLASGKTTSAMAHELSMSETTIKTYLARAYKKLGVHSRTEAVAVCLQNDLF